MTSRPLARPHRAGRSGSLLAAAMLAPLAGGCGAEDDTVTILAAASLSDVLPELVSLAEETTGSDVTFEVSYAGSAQLVQQANAGAAPDVLLLAGEEPLATLDADLGLSEPIVVATNSLTLVTAPGNPADIDELADVAAQGVTLVVCAPQVPCGSAAAQMFARADLEPAVASMEPDVRSTLAKVSSGEADAGVVYVTDAAGAGLPTVRVPPPVDVVNRYPALHDTDSPQGRDFLAVLRSPAGQDLLSSAGFGIP